MYPTNKLKIQELRVNRDKVFSSKLSKILKACEGSKNLIILIYQIEKEEFIYYNDAFRNIAGKNYCKLLEGGWSFWYKNIVPEESIIVEDRINNFLSHPQDQNSLLLRYHIINCAKEYYYVKHEIILHKLKNITLAVNYFFDVSVKEKIELCFAKNQELDNSYLPKKESRSISSREMEVLRLIGEGYSSKQIADKLCISAHTAISHRKNLIEKFEVKNTAQLIKETSGLIYM